MSGPGDRTVARDALVAFARSILVATGAPEQAALAVAESLVESDLVGHGSHGVRRLPAYAEAIEAGRLRPAARPEVAESSGATAIVDGHRGFGQLAARRAVEECVRLTRTYRLGTVAVRECGHIGRLGEYVAALAREDLIGIVLGNADPAVAPLGGRERRLGTNPFAWAVPRADGSPIVMDWATAATAEGKLAVALARGEPVPEGLLVDRDGAPTTDPAGFYTGGALLPFGGHKGYGLSVMIELVGGLLTGTGVSSLPGYDGCFGTVLVAIDIAAFVPPEHFRAEAEAFSRLLRDTPAAPGHEAVQVPGDPERRTRRERLATGIPVAGAVWAELRALATQVGAGEPARRRPDDGGGEPGRRTA